MDGGAGVMIDVPAITVSLQADARFAVTPSEMLEEVEYCLSLLRITKPKMAITIESHIPAHVGLGWRTQLRLGIGTTICLASNLPVDPATLAPRLGRGGTSGIGSWGFWHGGLIVDAGHPRDEKLTVAPSSQVKDPKLAPLIFHEKIPWWVVVGLAKDMALVSGAEEGDLFRRHTPIPWTESLESCRNVLLGLMPASKEQDFEAFCAAVSALRATGFKAREVAFRGIRGEKIISEFEASGLGGVSMSSWGPVFFGFARAELAAREAARKIQSCGLFERVWVSCVSQSGAIVRRNGEQARALQMVETIKAVPGAGAC